MSEAIYVCSVRLFMSVLSDTVFSALTVDTVYDHYSLLQVDKRSPDTMQVKKTIKLRLKVTNNMIYPTYK